MDTYKQKLESIAFSEPIFNKIEDIAHRHNLNIDQMGELAAEIREVITEIRPTANFIDDIRDRLEVSAEVAAEITTDVDTEIFKLIKSMVQQLMEVEQTIAKPQKDKVGASMSPTPLQTSTTFSSQAPSPSYTPPRPPTSPIEKAGDFEIIKTPVSHSPRYNDHTLTQEEVLADLENIEKLKPQNAETYVEHLIQSPEYEKQGESQPKQPPTSSPAVEPVPKPQEPLRPKREYTTDPYREPL